MLLSFIPYLGVVLASVGKGWSLTPLPVRLHARSTSSA